MTMKTAIAALAITTAFTVQAKASVVGPGPSATNPQLSGIELAQYARFHGHGPVLVRPGFVRPVPRPYYRHWVRRPYFGTVIAGVALGTILTAAVIGAAPPPPAPNLCWYWTDPSMTRGWWDYCY